MTVAERIDMPAETRDSIDKGQRLIRLDNGGLSLSERLATRFLHLIWRMARPLRSAFILPRASKFRRPWTKWVRCCASRAIRLGISAAPTPA